MSRRETDNPNWGGFRSGAGRPKTNSVDKEGKGHVAFEFSPWIHYMPIKTFTYHTGVVLKGGKEVPVVYNEHYKMWYEFGCTSNRVGEAYGSLMGGMIVDEHGMPLTKAMEARIYG